jgi:hypothetical protein
MTPYLNHSVTTAFLLEGYADFINYHGDETVLDASNVPTPHDVSDVLGGIVGGRIEAAQTLATYADLYDGFEARLEDVDFPGVFEYDVTNAMGMWFARYTVDHFAMPSREAFLLELGERVDAWLAEAGTI